MSAEFPTEDQVSLFDYGVYDRRYRLARGAGDDKVTAAILRNYEAITQHRFYGPLKALRALAQELRMDDPSDDGILELALAADTDYVTDDPSVQAIFDHGVCGVSDHVAESVDEYPDDWEEFRGDDGEIDLVAADIAEREENIRNVTYPVTDKISGETFYFQS